MSNLKKKGAEEVTTKIVKGAEKIVKKKVGTTLGKSIAAINPAQCLKEITTAYTEYKTIHEQEKTKRQQINAWENITIKKIHAQRKILMEYLDRSFDERKENFKNLFDTMDKAVENGDTQSLALVLKSITDLAASGPFKEIASVDMVKGILTDPEKEFEF